MEVKVKSNMNEVLRKLGTVHKKYVAKALVTALNKVPGRLIGQMVCRETEPISNPGFVS